MKRKATLVIAFLTTLLLASCTTPAAQPTATPTVEQPTAEPTAAAGAELPVAVEYNLGETIVEQSRFPEDSPFRNMPVRLNGVIAAPTDSVGPHPVVVIFHGTHPGCPEDEAGVDRWPCDPEVEQPNYRGFAYLVEALAAQGYVALAPNINAENTFGFGEPVAGERFAQLAELHLKALAEAAAGGAHGFGVALEGQADISRLAFFGHSRGGEGASWLTNGQGLAAPDAGDAFGYGPVEGLLLIAPSPGFTLPAASRVPLAVVLPACDGDVINQEGQLFYEGPRMDPAQEQWALSVWLERGNHNNFNEILGADPFGNRDRPDCKELLAPEAQRDFLVNFATSFLTTIFSEDPQAVDEALAALGMDVTALAPGSVLGLPARVMTLAEAANRMRLVTPTGAEEMTTNLVGGAVTAEKVNLFYCEAGYYTPLVKPGSEPCKRVNLTIPGHPAMLVTSWEQPGAMLSFTLPDDAGDLTSFTTVSLRAAVDPLSTLNARGQPQAFSVRLSDRTGATATVQTRTDEPALSFPPGDVEEDDIFEGGLFNGKVPMTTIRVLLSDFSGVDLSQISEIALLFDQTDSGALFMGDVELVEDNHDHGR